MAPGNDAHDGVGHAGCGQFAAGEHEIADRNLLCDEVLTNAVVDALVVSTENNEVALHREAVGHGLVELFTVGRGENHFVIVAFGLERCDAVVDGLALHHHSRKAAIGIVVDAAMFVGGVVTQVVHMNFDQSFFLRSRQDGGVEEAVEHFGNYGDDVDAMPVKLCWGDSYSLRTCGRRTTSVLCCKGSEKMPRGGAATSIFVRCGQKFVHGGGVVRRKSTTRCACARCAFRKVERERSGARKKRKRPSPVVRNRQGTPLHRVETGANHSKSSP